MEVRQILVPMDFSSHSSVAMDAAVDLAKRFGAQIHLLHAYHLPITVATPDQMVLPAGFWSSVKDAAQQRLDEAAERVREAGVPVEIHLSDRVAALSIIDLAVKLGADLIVMGTRGNTGIKHVLLGSVAERVIRLAHCPVLTLKATERDSRRSPEAEG
ncbi:MAG: universal stress protein [Myxococcota bacterium]